MTAVADLSAELARELAANDQERVTAAVLDDIASSARRLVDPRTMPARFHNLRAVATSPAHGFASFQHGGFAESLAMRIGSGTHAQLLGTPPCAALPKHIKQRRGKVYEAWRKLQPENALVLTRKEYERSSRMAESIRANEYAANLLFGPGTLLEQKILWTQRGRARQSTPDARGPYYLAELKSTRCSEPGKFVRDAGYRSYHVQLADQAAAIESTTGKTVDEVYVVAVESAPPFAVTVFQVSSATMRKGRHLAELWLGTLLECEARGEWSRAYTDKIEILDIQDDGMDLWSDADAEVPEWAKPDAPDEP